MKIVRLRLSGEQITPVNTRLEDGVVQFTPDGGTTWIDVPELDPRTSDAYQIPMTPTDNTQCDAATRAIALMHEQIDGVVNALTATQAANFLLDLILLFVPGFGLIVGVIWLVVEGILFIGQTAIDTAFTDDVYTRLKCLWQANVGMDGVMTDAGMVAFLNDVSAAYPTDGVIAATVSLLCDNFGRIAFNNAAALRTETGDCNDCAVCADYADNFAFTLGAQSSFLAPVGISYQPTREGGQLLSGGGAPHTEFIGSTLAASGEHVVSVWVDMGRDCEIATVTYFAYMDSTGFPRYLALFSEDGTNVYGNQSTASIRNVWQQVTLNPGLTARYICFKLISTAAVACYLDDIHIVVA